MSIYFAPDGYDHPCLWVEYPGKPPILIAEQWRTHRIVWDLLLEKWGQCEPPKEGS